jgi:hypothetical protein
MNSRFKFPRRVRIHGGECGAVARALHHKVKGLSLYQADYEKASLSTIERKQMSTKTTLKRIALVAVSAMGFGLMTSIAPANATGAVEPTSITVGTIPSASVGSVHATPVTIAFPGTDDGSDTFAIAVRVTSAPTGSGYKNFNDDLASGETTSGTNVKAKVTITRATGNDGLGTTAAAASSTSEVDGQTVAMLYTSSNATGTADKASFLINVTPDVAGTYTVLVSTRDTTSAVTAANAPVYAAGDASATYSFATGTSPTTATLATVTGATVTGATDTIGRLMKVTLNSGAVLGVGETITLTTNNTSAQMAIVQDQSVSGGSMSGYATTQVLNSSHFVGGVAYFKLTDSTATASTTVVTATGSGLLSPSVTSTVSSTTVLLAASAAITVNNGVDAVRPGSGKVGGTAGATFTDTSTTSATSHTYGLTSTTTTATVTRMTVTDTTGDLTGIVGLTYGTNVTTAVTTGLGTVTFSGALATAGDSFTATIHSTTPATITVTSAAATLSGTTGSCTAEPIATISAAHGSSVTATVLCKDQFGAAVANSAMTVSVTGRNATTTSAALATDSTGRASYTLVDTGTAATLLTQSVIAFNTALTADTTVTVNYSADKVSAVALSTPTSLDTAATGVTYSDINASSSTGTQATLVTITATVTDVNGAVLVGVPVTFTTTDAGAAVLSTKATVYTGTDGKAASSVYGWTAGTKTFTATAGAVSKTGTVSFRQGGATGTNSPTEVRTIEASRSGNIITVTAKDRFGNVVQGVPLWGTRTGNGLFGGGNNVAGRITDVNGKAEFVFNGGSEASVVTIQAGGDGSSTAPTDACYGQTGAKAGIVVCSTATTQTAFAATVAGTTTTAETGVGATLSPAGINSVTVSVPADTAQLDSINAATDAAAEAIDAANAATDAANLAAEARDAADAATAAVEELATQVATLMAALKAQITTLANTVAKIAKKVKA